MTPDQFYAITVSNADVMDALREQQAQVKKFEESVAAYQRTTEGLIGQIEDLRDELRTARNDRNPVSSPELASAIQDRLRERKTWRSRLDALDVGDSFCDGVKNARNLRTAVYAYSQSNSHKKTFKVNEDGTRVRCTRIL